MVRSGQLEFVEVNKVKVATPRAHEYWRANFGEAD